MRGVARHRGRSLMVVFFFFFPVDAPLGAVVVACGVVRGTLLVNSSFFGPLRFQSSAVLLIRYARYRSATSLASPCSFTPSFFSFPLSFLAGLGSLFGVSMTAAGYLFSLFDSSFQSGRLDCLLRPRLLVGVIWSPTSSFFLHVRSFFSFLSSAGPFVS